MTKMRTGIGFDLHRTCTDRPLILGGVTIDGDIGLLGHSDADVVLHAICDAVLGAAALGDIGDFFPDTDPTYKGADSRVLTRDVLGRVKALGWKLENIDVIIHAQVPKLGPHKQTIRKSVAETLELPTDAVCIKATTNEKLDAIGRGEAIACWATALLSQ